jgi:two-component system nitrogen regulation sensor histidine kinase NtrY
MVGELEASRREVEGYSRNLEGMVEARTAELRASQASLLALKNHLATVIANVGTGVLSLDEDGRIETFNERASEILGLAPEGARGRTLEETLGGAATARIAEVVSVVRDGREEWSEAQVTCDLPQGRRTLSVAASALRGEGQRPIGTVVVIEDLTEILATQRLTAWKEAVERVIHEIKNPLTPVGLAAETLKTAWGRDPARFAGLFPSAIDMILGAVRDLKDLIGEFSRFSRLPAMQPERNDPNALDAMAETGGELRRRTAREDGGVAIRVDDDGPGVEDADRIFEPHYTTKVKGLGLGLAIARQIVEEHGGTIRAESVPGKGTSVRIHLPAAAPGTPGAAPAAPGGGAPRLEGPSTKAP